LGALLSISHVSKAFGNLTAVDDVSLEVGENEIFGIAGPNGAGKTTLFNLTTGIPFHADSGTIEFEGRRIERMAPHAIAHLGIARTFQHEAAFDTLTTAQNVRMGAVFGRGHDPPAVATDRTLELLDLQDEREELAGELPLYAKKRLMLASALATSPSLLMLDEPAAGLNHMEMEELHRLILRVRDMGIAVIMIEHVLPLLFGVSDTVMIMDYGQVLTRGAPSDVARDEQVIEAYLGERGRREAHAQG
jgi:branched-chain amino acid transport system ATP-binding protein